MKFKALPFLAPALGLLLSGPEASSAILYYRSTTAANTWTGSFWGTAAGGPYTSAYVSGSDVVFESNGGTGLAITGATTNFASITANENVTVTAGGTIGTGGTVASITVASGKNLNFAGQAFSTAAGTGLIKNGAGTLTLAGGNYTGGFTLNAGTVAVGGVNAMGAGGTLTINGGTISSSSTAARDLSGKYTGGITIGGDFTLGDVTNNGGLTFTNNMALGAANRNITVNSAVSMGGVISGGTNIGFTKLGNGTLTLSGTNTYTGTATISAGVLTITSTNALAGFSTNGRYSVSSGATLAVTNAITDANITSMLGTTNFAAGSLLGFDTSAAARSYGSVLANTTQGALGINKIGTNTLTLTASNTYTGTTLVTAGTLALGHATNTLADTGAVTVAGGTLSLGTNNDTIGALTLTSGTISGTGTLTASSYSVQSGTINANLGGTASLSKTSTGTVTISNTSGFTNNISITGGVLSINTASQSGGNLAYAGNLSGSGTLNKAGVGTITLSGNNSGFTGSYVINNGTVAAGDLIFSSSSAIGAPTSWTTAVNNAGGTGGIIFNLGTGNSATVSGGWTISARTNNTSAIRVSSGDITLSGNIAMQSGGSQYLILPESGASLRLSGNLSTTAGGTRTFTFSGAGTGYMDGVISNGTGATPVFILEKTGTGTWFSNNDHTYTGNNSLVNGVLSTASLANGGVNSGIGASTSIAANLVFNGGALAYTGVGASTDRLFTINPRGGSIDSSGTGAMVFTNPGAIVSGIGGAAPNPQPTFTSGATTITYLRNADLGVGMSISGTGIQAGTTITAINTELGTVTLSNATTSASAGSYTVSGNVNRTFNLTGSNTNANEIAGSFSDATGGGTLSIAKSGSGFWKLSGTNTYTGGTSLNGGTLELGSSGAIGRSGTLSFGGGRLQYSASNTTDYSSRFSTAAGQVYSVNTNGQSVTWATGLTSTGGTLSKSGSGTLILTGANSHTTTTISGGTLQVGNGGTSGTLGSGAITNNASLSFNRSNDLTVANDISGTGSLSKSGNGSLNLTGTNTYIGATTVSAGTLLVNGTLGNTALTLAGGATLGGDGTSAGSVATVSSTSVIAPGNSPGTLTIGSLDVTNGGTFNFELGTNSDLLAITGALTAGGTLNFNFSDSGGLTGYTSYTLFTFDSQSGLDYADLNALTLPGQALNTSFGTGGWMITGNSLQVQFVPEPSSVLLGLLGAAGILGRRRRQSV